MYQPTPETEKILNSLSLFWVYRSFFSMRTLPKDFVYDETPVPILYDKPPFLSTEI